MPELAEDVKNVPEGCDVTGRSYVAQRLLLLPNLMLPRADLEADDDNIKRHLDVIDLPGRGLSGASSSVSSNLPYSIPSTCCTVSSSIAPLFWPT